MTFWEHLDELRGTVLRSLLAVFAASILSWGFKDFVFNKIVLYPLSNEFFLYKWLPAPESVSLVNLEISGQIIVHLKVGLIVGIILVVPYIIWEIWKFISPALYKEEKTGLNKFFALSSLLFYLGAAIGYFILFPICLSFFQNYHVSDNVYNSFSLQSYISLFNAMVLLLGLVFEFPVLILILSRVGIINKSMLKQGRSYAIVVVLVLSAIITPADLCSMLIVALPLYLLYEASIAFCIQNIPNR